MTSKLLLPRETRAPGPGGRLGFDSPGMVDDLSEIARRSTIGFVKGCFRTADDGVVCDRVWALTTARTFLGACRGVPSTSVCSDPGTPREIRPKMALLETTAFGDVREEEGFELLVTLLELVLDRALVVAIFSAELCALSLSLRFHMAGTVISLLNNNGGGGRFLIALGVCKGEPVAISPCINPVSGRIICFVWKRVETSSAY